MHFTLVFHILSYAFKNAVSLCKLIKHKKITADYYINDYDNLCFCSKQWQILNKYNLLLCNRGGHNVAMIMVMNIVISNDSNFNRILCYYLRCTCNVND